MESTIEFAAEGEDNDYDGDVWRYDNTVLNELEDFLSGIDSGTREKPAEAEDDTVKKLLAEVQQELADAKAEITQLRTDNAKMKRVMELGDDPAYATAYVDAEQAAKKSQRLWEDLKDVHSEISETTLDLYKVPSSKHADNGGVISKRGRLKLNNMDLDVELIGGETLELTNCSKEGHKHCSRLDLTYINEVGIVKNNECAFKVKSVNGAYIMATQTPDDAKSWCRAIEISIRVARQRKNN
eukprot:TRINITY_DN6014_c0_g1_i2.p1 TRINITY_DN6014_c0_g1~~TRINITY_DN6014_c0_g1_i2.p1  ORF type:complete len:241 (-),score=59.21 TRINITY_DN6014_c0_g1_i2:279-1001(-)